MSKKGMPRSDACWMKAIRGIPTNSAALPLEILPWRYSSRTINSRAVSFSGLSNICSTPANSGSSGMLIVIVRLSALLRQRLLARFLRQTARVLQARLFVVSGDGIERRLGRGLFHHVLARHFDLAVILPARARRHQPAHDHVLLQPAQVVHLAVDGGFGEHARGLLEGRRRNERIGRKRCLGDAQQYRLALRRPL